MASGPEGRVITGADSFVDRKKETEMNDASTTRLESGDVGSRARRSRSGRRSVRYGTSYEEMNDGRHRGTWSRRSCGLNVAEMRGLREGDETVREDEPRERREKSTSRRDV